MLTPIDLEVDLNNGQESEFVAVVFSAFKLVNIPRLFQQRSELI